MSDSEGTKFIHVTNPKTGEKVPFPKEKVVKLETITPGDNDLRLDNDQIGIHHSSELEIPTEDVITDDDIHTKERVKGAIYDYSIDSNMITGIKDSPGVGRVKPKENLDKI